MLSKEPQHPVKAEKIQSQRHLQRIRKFEQYEKDVNSQNDLMNTAITDKNNLWSKVKQMRDNKSKNNDIPYIETMAGRFEENEVLEGF